MLPACSSERSRNTFSEMSRSVQPRSPSPSPQLKCACFSTTAGCPANGGGSSCGWTTSSCCVVTLTRSEHNERIKLCDDLGYALSYCHDVHDPSLFADTDMSLSDQLALQHA